MSIGDLKDYGNKGNNFPWQLKVLQGLQAVIDNNCCDSILAQLISIDSKLRSEPRRANVLNTSTNGTVPVCYSFSIANVGAAAGTVNTQSIPAGTTVNFDAGVLNNTLTGATYDATGTTFLITYITD
jgi:hypothetical protein